MTDNLLNVLTEYQEWNFPKTALIHLDKWMVFSIKKIHTESFNNKNIKCSEIYIETKDMREINNFENMLIYISTGCGYLFDNKKSRAIRFYGTIRQIQRNKKNQKITIAITNVDQSLSESPPVLIASQDIEIWDESTRNKIFGKVKSLLKDNKPCPA